MNQQRPLKDEPTLSDSEFEDAILGAISDGTAQGRARQLGIALLHQALQEVNPLQLTVESTTLYERTAITDLPASSLTTPINLDIKEGATRHNFNDGYFAFTFFSSRTNFTNPNPDRYSHRTIFVFKDRWFNTQGAGNEVIQGYVGTSPPRIWKASNTSFFAFVAAGNTTSLYRIDGHKLSLNLQTP